MEKLLMDNAALVRRCANRYLWAVRRQAVVDMDDLTQTGWLAVITAARTFDPARGEWNAWASMCIHQAMQRALSLLREPETCSLDAPVPGCEDLTIGDTIPDDAQPPTDAALLQSESARAVRSAVQALSDPVQRNAFELTHLRGHTAQEAADQLGVSVGEVRAMNAKSLRQLRRDRHLLPFVGLDDVTQFGRGKSAAAFQRDQTSAVEAAVLWREQARAKLEAMRRPRA